MAHVFFRFYEELNDFLPLERRKTSFAHHYRGNTSVKDAIEKIGVPHPEVDLILVNSEAVDFSYRLKALDRISVYPVFESFDISGLSLLRERPLREPRFIADSHLGRLVKYLRMLGLDTLYDNHYDDSEIVDISNLENRTVLTRDIGLLKMKDLTHGYYIRSQQVDKQIKEVLQRFDLWPGLQPFSRCLACNGVIKEVSKETVNHLLPRKIRIYFCEFYRCDTCHRVFWKGDHYQRMAKWLSVMKEFP